MGTIYATASNSTTTSNSTTASNSTTVTSSNLTTELFADSNFGGNSTIINENMPLLQDPFQDAFSSINITEAGNQSSGYMIEICEHKSYSGDCTILGPGAYDVDTLDGLHDQISSMRSLSPKKPWS